MEGLHGMPPVGHVVRVADVPPVCLDQRTVHPKLPDFCLCLSKQVESKVFSNLFLRNQSLS